jgi:hypothetical protein
VQRADAQSLSKPRRYGHTFGPTRLAGGGALEGVKGLVVRSGGFALRQLSPSASHQFASFLGELIPYNGSGEALGLTRT